MNVTQRIFGGESHASPAELIVYFLSRTKLIWSIGISLYVILVIMGEVTPPWEFLTFIDDPVSKAALLSFLGVSAAYYIVVKSWVKKLVSPPQVFVIRVNLTKIPPVDVHAGHPDLWDEVSIVSGQPAEYVVGGTVVYVVTDFADVEDIDEDDEIYQHVPKTEEGELKPEGKVVAGSWLGEASDAEIAHVQHQVEANRRRNNVYARLGEKLVAKFESVADRVESEHHQAMNRKSREKTLYREGESVDKVLRAEIPEYADVDKPVSDIIEDEISRQMEELNTADTGGVIPGDEQ